MIFIVPTGQVITSFEPSHTIFVVDPIIVERNAFLSGIFKNFISIDMFCYFDYCGVQTSGCKVHFTVDRCGWIRIGLTETEVRRQVHTSFNHYPTALLFAN